ncbi:MAG: hypothetical protein V4568_13390 [Pseudomonadota bacterium]
MSTLLRKAAVMLHGVSEQDQAWILDRLPENSRQELEALIGELQELGFDSADCALVDLPSQRNDVQAPTQVETTAGNAITKIEKCPLPLLIEWGNEEAEWVVAQVLLQRKWSWTVAFLTGIKIDKKNRLEKIRRELAVLSQPMAERLLIRLADYFNVRFFCDDEESAVGDLTMQGSGQPTKVKKWLRSFVQRT